MCTGAQREHSVLGVGAAPKMADSVCLHCLEQIKRRKKDKRLDKYSMSMKLRKQHVTVFEALQKVYLYEVSFSYD